MKLQATCPRCRTVIDVFRTRKWEMVTCPECSCRFSNILGTISWILRSKSPSANAIRIDMQIWGTIIGGIIIVPLLWNLIAPSGKNGMGTATLAYWENLRTAVNDGKQADKKTDPIATLREGNEECSRLCLQINGLSVVEVDPEATTYAAEMSALVGELQGAYDEAEQFLGKREQQNGTFNLLAEGAESFLRGFVGDVKGVLDKNATRSSETRADIAALEDRFNAVISKMRRLKANEITIRASLSKKYNREFLPIDWVK